MFRFIGQHVRLLLHQPQAKRRGFQQKHRQRQASEEEREVGDIEFSSQQLRDGVFIVAAEMAGIDVARGPKPLFCRQREIEKSPRLENTGDFGEKKRCRLQYVL